MLIDPVSLSRHNPTPAISGNGAAIGACPTVSSEPGSLFCSRNANHRLLSASNKQRCNRIVQQRLWSLRLAFANGSSNALPKMLLSVSFQGFGMHVFGTNICDNQRCRHSGSTWMCSAGSKMQQQSIAGNAPFPRTHSSVC